MNKRYGSAPVEIKVIELNPSEMMFILYLPISLRVHKYEDHLFKNPFIVNKINYQLAIPDNLRYINPIIDASINDMLENGYDFDYNIYVTAKTMFVQPGMSGNRPGWHVDGYGSNGDINYIWYNMNPTEFAIQNFVNIPDDDIESMKCMEKQIEADKIVTYPCNTLLRLDESVVHRVNENIRPGIRTFIKISFSKHRYNLKGNAHNYLIDYDWEMYDRYPDRRNIDNKDYVVKH